MPHAASIWQGYNQGPTHDGDLPYHGIKSKTQGTRHSRVSANVEALLEISKRFEDNTLEHSLDGQILKPSVQGTPHQKIVYGGMGNLLACL